MVSPGNLAEHGKRTSPPVPVEVDSVRYGSLAETRQLTGSVHPYYQYIVAPKVSGRVISIRKRIGDWVESGEVLVLLDDAEYQQSVREAEANLKIAQASLIEAESQAELSGQELERVESLQNKGMVSSAEYDAAVSHYKAQESRSKLAQAQVEQREASLRLARIKLSYTVLNASQPGFIGERFVDEGALLAPNSPVLSVLGIDTVFVRTTIVERDYGRIEPGQSGIIQVDAYPDREFNGVVTRIAPKLQETSRVAEMEVKVINDSLWLKPGMFAKLNLKLREKENARIVPTQAIINKNGESAVFQVNGDPASPVALYFIVETGISTPLETEILSPPLDGLVITLGQHLLEDGSPIILPQDFNQNDDSNP
ncbi:efflux RND transporter periplasmic adaptor subunit [bacterium]|nr:efflux RND transporter periplasmic adaptor subunit [bacterium]